MIGQATERGSRRGKRDAILYACGANATNGIRRTNADKRQAVERLLTDEKWSLWSNVTIAKHCLVSNGTTYQQDTRNIGKKPLPDGAFNCDPAGGCS